jgi:hypothetical protein
MLSALAACASLLSSSSGLAAANNSELSHSARAEGTPDLILRVTGEEITFGGYPMSYDYYVGYLDKAHTRIFRAVFGSLGSAAGGDGSHPDRIGVRPPCTSPSSEALKVQWIEDWYVNEKGVRDKDRYTFELLAGWAGVEFLDTPRQAAEAVPDQARFALKEAESAVPTLFPIAWRFITSDGFRTGANSSTFFSSVTSLPNGDRDVRSYSDAGSVVYAPLKFKHADGQGAKDQDSYRDSADLATGDSAKLVRAKDPSENTSDEKDNLNCEENGFLKEAREFFAQVKAKHAEEEARNLRRK